MDAERLERTLTDAFHGGEVRRRELRLDEGAARDLARRAARVSPMGDGWYEVELGGNGDGQEA